MDVELAVEGEKAMAVILSDPFDLRKRIRSGHGHLVEESMAAFIPLHVRARAFQSDRSDRHGKMYSEITPIGMLSDTCVLSPTTVVIASIESITLAILSHIRFMPAISESVSVASQLLMMMM
jgi:hypothetical protein